MQGRFTVPSLFCLSPALRLFCWGLGLPVALFHSTLNALSLEHFSSLLPISLRWWVIIGFGRDAVFTPTSVVDHASVKLNDCMDARQHCWCQPGTGMHNGLLCLDESHQKGSDYITSSQNCLLVHLHMMHAYSLRTGTRQRCTCVFLVWLRVWDTALKTSSIELHICTVHITNLNKIYVIQQFILIGVAR